MRGEEASRLLALLAAHPEGLNAAQVATLDKRVSLARASSALQHLRALGFARARHEGGRVQVWRVTDAGTAALAEEGGTVPGGRGNV